MDEELLKKIQSLEDKIDQSYKMLKAAKNMFMWNLILSLVFFLLPLIAIIFLLPSMISTITSSYSGLL